MGFLSGSLKFLPLIVSAVTQVERLVVRLRSPAKGREKQDAAVDLVRVLLETPESIAERDLLDNAEVDTAARAVIDAVVALQNIVRTATQGHRADA